MDLAALGDRREPLADIRFASGLLRERLRPCDARQFGVAILSRNASRILRVQEPMNVSERTGGPIPGLRNEWDVTELREAIRRAALAPDRKHFMEWDEQVCVLQRPAAQVIAGVWGELPAFGETPLKRRRIGFDGYQRPCGGDAVGVFQRPLVGHPLRHVVCPFEGRAATTTRQVYATYA